MFRRSHLAVAAAAALSFTTLALAGDKDGDRDRDRDHDRGKDRGLHSLGEGEVSVEAVAKPALGKFSGSVDGIKAKERDGNIVFTVELPRGMKMGMRDSHAREAFEVDKHKDVKLVVDKGKLKFPEDNKSVDGEVKGDLTLHGKTKPVTIKYKARRTGSDLHLKGSSFSFNYLDFGVEKICKMGVCVEPTVTITVERLKLRDK